MFSVILPSISPAFCFLVSLTTLYVVAKAPEAKAITATVPAAMTVADKALKPLLDILTLFFLLKLASRLDRLSFTEAKERLYKL